jgi:alkyldihydroxyacetonephosphate synthase
MERTAAECDGIRTSDGALDRFAAARDLWPGGTLDFWHGLPLPLPERVFWPEDDDEVMRVLQHADRARIPVIPYGAGSGVCGGARGREGAIVLDTKGLSRIGPLDEERWTVEVESGVNGQHLEDWLASHGFTLGHSPSSIWCSTVGGWAAARGAGQFSSRYGVFEDMVLAIEAVAPGIGRFKVGEGGDAPAEWFPLLLGSEGTLAVITRLTLRVWPQPAARRLRGWRFSSVEAALRAMRRLMQSELWPAVVRMYDPVDTQVGGRTKPHRASVESAGFVRRWLGRVDRLPQIHRQTLALPLALPGLVNQLFDRISSGCLVISGWEGEPSVVDALAGAGERILREEGEDLGPEPGERWLASRHHVSYKLMPIFERGGFADTMEAATNWSGMERLYHGVRAAVSGQAVVMAHVSHVYPEGGSIYFSFAGRGDRETYDETWRRALDAVLAVGATVTHHHGVGTLKADAVSREVGPCVAAWRALKDELDPNGILNPGRVYVDGVSLPGPEVAPPALSATDGLVRVARGSTRAEREEAARAAGGELCWPWERLPGPPRWQQAPWHSAWVEMTGAIDGVECRLGRGPRSASGPDLRGWLWERAATCAVGVAPEGERWLGEGRPPKPWLVARDLLRGDLRPAVLFAKSGVLRVGFRGPAARELGAIASRLVPGGLSEVPWETHSLPGGPLVPCNATDRSAVWVTQQGAFKRAKAT